MSERDLIGYDATPPRVRWPNDARIAISLVVNYSVRTRVCGYLRSAGSQLLEPHR
jgi:hypothetical protein